MDTFSIVAIAILVIILIIIIAALHAQQSNQLREIQYKLEQIQEHETKALRSPDALRHKRTDFIESLMIIESELQSGRRTQVSDEEFQNFELTRPEIMDINEQLKTLDAWLGPPFDLDWVEILARLPTLQSLRTQREFQTEDVPAITSGN